MKIITIPLIVITGLVISHCSGPSQKKPAEAKVPETRQVIIPNFNADSAYFYVKTQVDFGPRVPNTSAHLKCAAWLISKLKADSANMTVQSGKITAYNGNQLNFQNIIASWKPALNNRVLLCAHWDARPYADQDKDPANRRKPIDAANDGASGVGILLEIARQISIAQPAIGIDIVLFDAEDYGPPQDQRTGEDTEKWWGQGSQYWAQHPHRENYTAKYGILLDMVGAPNATFLREGISMNYAASIVRHVWNTAETAGYSNYFIDEDGTYVTDDHLFINRILNIPTIDIIHLDRTSPSGFYPYWHTTQDNMQSIDKKTLQAVGQTLLTVIYEEN